MNGKFRRWMVDVLIILVIGAYAFIFDSVLGKINDNAISIKENITRIENLNPTILDIKTDLSSIRTDIEWIKKALNGSLK